MSFNNICAALKSIANETNSEEFANTCRQVGKSLNNGTLDQENAIRILSEYIIKFDDAKLFLKYLSKILLALVSTHIPLKPVFSNVNFDASNDSEKTNHLEYSIVLSLLSEHPDILQYALKYFEINVIPPYDVFIHHDESYNVAPKKRRLQDCRQKITDQLIVQCCYTLLKKMPNEFATKWDWTSFIMNFSQHADSEVRWMVKECMAILTNMTEIQSKALSQNLNLVETDLIKLKNSAKIYDEFVNQASENILDTVEISTENVVNIDGIMLPIYNKINCKSSNLVPVKSTVNNLRSIALAVASGKAISLMGPVGSGKTSLVEHLSSITGRKGEAFKKVQLGDQTDSRLLLGSHQCTDIPGEFVWRPGVLTDAVQNGHWLLLEDIDCAALDVASTLSSLLERNTLCVPGYRDALSVTPGFQLFVTQRTTITNFGFQKKMSNSSTLLQKHLTQINVEPLSRAELSQIIETKYPVLKSICPRMIEVFMMFSVGSHDSSLHTTEAASDKTSNVNVIRGSRLISTRDLLKWCSRAVVGYKVSSPDSAIKVLQDALDIFTCSVSSPDDRLMLAKKVGTCLGIVDTKTEFYFKHYKPNVSLTPSMLEVGRAKVPRSERSLESIDFNSKQTVFSFTRQSACLLEKISCCVTSHEPVLLVGETGTGKTSTVQYIAKQTGHKLVVINMNQQSDSADLLGGYKPVDLKYVIKPIKNEFEALFRGFYNVEKNKKFLNHIDTCYETESWSALLTLMKTSHKSAVKRIASEKKEKLLNVWKVFGKKLQKLEQQIKSASRLTFSFIEGSLVKAMQEGHWVLLDEINLASPEILECLAGLLEDKDETMELLEKGDKVPIKRHTDFILFACMNPATDVGKKDLPVGLRNRFTEFFIDELTERNDLMLLIGDYLYHMNLGVPILEAIYNFYATIKKEAKLNLVDGSGNTPHYSLRTLCRALTSAARAKCGTVARSLYEAFCLAFLTQLDSSSHPKVEAMIAKAVIGKKSMKSVLNQIIPEPQNKGQNFLLFEGHWIPQGKLDIDIPEGYILTATVRKNLRDIARIISLGKLPVLLQGDTSVGKTSLITYIAKASGNFCVRINNHEHTDLQEYIGSYASDASGKLVFKEGVLVEAMTKGYWIILDELNLAPSDVLEALNRVLDDNRELYIPETQQVVRADPNFMLFATQNPPGLYGGRKMLSRAFRNRFVELHFDEIPRKELEIILHQRCHVPPAYCKKMIAVMAELQVRRRGSAAVQGKDGFITLRDLFRWGQRYRYASKEFLTDDKFYDWDQHIADEGYLILAGKVRQTDERSIIEEVIEKNIKRKVCPDNLFSLHPGISPVTKQILETILNYKNDEFSHVVWTYNMRRLAVLIVKSFTYNEPVLLVGETGCGKTTICQVLAALRKRQLLSVNCHMHTESSDFLGGLRPVRQYNHDGRLFEWADGPLIKAMENGDIFLADEISLADDSVLERMNSLLEPERQLVLTERGMEENSDIVVITAEKDFHFIGTMNPGGDFGKKELSPALRNRFTEIWCDSVTSKQDLLSVLERSVSKGISLGNQEDGSSGIGNSILDFTDWIRQSEVTNKFPFSIRDLLSWVQFINVTVAKGLIDATEAYVHGACMTLLDCFGTALTGHIEPETLTLLRKSSINFLLNQIKCSDNDSTEALRKMLSHSQVKFVAESDNTRFGIKPFYVDVGNHLLIIEQEQKFTFVAPTTGSNTLRLLRGLQLNKAILLEGNPGVGKTSLVTALAKSSGHKIVRINLSDQTDITDLFGTDLPAEDGSFIFKEGAFLSALKNGDWILLDELNLAPQPVLEGLNACLDHRGEVFIPELGKTFKVKKETRLFACQNPLKQGGARRGLPVSFLNRFTQVYIDTLTKEDMIYIVESQYPSLPKDVLHKIVEFNCKVAHEITEVQSWGHRGSPWEMNLRDIQRWCEALIADQEKHNMVAPGKFVDMLYINRMRTAEDKNKMAQNYDQIFCPNYPRSHRNPLFHITDKEISIGDVTIARNKDKYFKNRRTVNTNLLVLRNQLSTIKTLAQSVKMNWLSILVGPSSTGKSNVVQVLADLTGNDLQIVSVTSAMDVSDLLGGFEQVDYNRKLENLFDTIETLTIKILRDFWMTKPCKQWKSDKLLNQLHQYKNIQTKTPKGNEEFDLFSEKINFLSKHVKKLIETANREREGEVYNKLHDIMNILQNLERKVSKSTSVNTGGKFEWIDALLVKTLIEGSWLLLDNVNLTSAAVLDRLNGLLEPNGVLSIPERGEFSEITPHPNFRVFFTMDPKYGEISRAMRNRGIEIFLLRPEDCNTTLTDTMPYLDLIALLSSTGLSCQYHELSIKCHDLMTSYIQGFERPTISHLLQASHLTDQQIVRGVSYKAAMMNSFSDVYIKSRCGNDFASNVKASLAEMKNEMYQSLEKLILEHVSNDCKHVSCSHTLTVKGLCSDSSTEIARQITYLPIRQSKAKETPDEVLNTLLSIFTAYQRCPNELLNNLQYLIKNVCDEKSKSNIKLLYKELSEKALLFIQNSDNNINVYKRFYPEFKTANETEQNVANTKTILLYFELLKCFVKKVLPRCNLTALDYSKAVHSGSLTDDFVEYPILKYCQNYLDLIDSHVETAIKTAQNTIDDKKTCDIIQLLNYRSRFVKLASLPIFEVKNNKAVFKEDLVPLLYTHLKWLQKHLIGYLAGLLPQEHNLLTKFNEILKSIMLHDIHDNVELLKIAKKLRKLYGEPKLYRDQNEFDLSCTKSDLLKQLSLDLNQPLQRQFFALTFDNYTLHVNNLGVDVPKSTNLIAIRESIAKDLEKTNRTLGVEVALMPINSYILQRVLNLLQRIILEVTTAYNHNGQIKDDSKQAVDILKFLVYYGTTTRTLAPALSNLMNVVLDLLSDKPVTEVERLSSLQAKLWDEFYKAITNSPANYPLSFFSVDKQVSNADTPEEIPINTKRLSCNLPLMSYYVQKLVVSTSEEDQRHIPLYETVSLQHRDEYSEQLETVQQILWQNIITLNKAASLKMKSDAEFEIKKYEQLKTYSHTICKGAEFLTALKEHMKNKDNAFVEMFENADRICETLKVLDFFPSDKVQIMNVKVLTAQLSLLTSLLFGRVISEISPVDHVERYRLKIQYIEEDVKMFDALLSSYYMHGVVSGTIYEDKDIAFASQVDKDSLSKNKDDLNNVHPYCKHISELKVRTADKVHKYASGNTFRPEAPSYNTFVKDCRHFTKSVLSAKTVKDLVNTLFCASTDLYNSMKSCIVDKTVITNAWTVSKETLSWLYSVNAFYKKVNGSYSDVFPDLAIPLQRSLSQIVASVTLLNDILRELVVKIERGSNLDLISQMVVYPNNLSHPFDWESNLHRFISNDFEHTLRKNIVTSCDDTFSVDLELIQVLKMNLLELKMYSNALETSDNIIFAGVLQILNKIVKAWENQQRDIEKKKEDDEALYVTKSKCEDEDEEAMDQEQILEMFPAYSDHDFAEFKQINLEENTKKNNARKEKPKLLISSDDVSLVCKWHSDYIRNVTSAEWLPIQEKIVNNDVVSPFLARYSIFSRAMENGWDALDADSEVDMTPSLLVLLEQIKSKVEGRESHTKTDFYKSPWVSETRQCVPLLQRVKDSTNKLLDQWPDFPTLKDIIIIVDRILSFPVTSPVSRFLTGLELLRDKIEEWNKNAHKENNLIEVSLAVGQQIINWRKLEMGHWKECLNNVYSRKQSEAHKYWFYLYSVVNSYLNPESTEETVLLERVVAVLKDFMETSNLAEYEIRLDIVYTYHCHLIHFEANQRRDELISILWNTYNYYTQFLPQLMSQIKEKRAPIEKKLKDFVKICTWDKDLSYWSVKDTVEKAHKALHKHVKEFEKVLKEPAAPYLIDNKGEIQEHVGIWDRPKRATTGANAAPGGAYLLDVQNYIVLARTVKKYLDEAEEPCSSINEGSLLSKVPSLLNKAKTLCKDTITNTGYPSLVQALDDFTTSVIETSTHLGSLDVDASLPKDKQKSQAKNIVQQKRKALADLFKYLSKMGLNYRTGLVLLNSETELYDFTIAPMDLDAAMSYLKSRRCDNSLALLWSGCEKYFQKNITRHRYLAAALQSPHRDLGMQNIERCKGFAAQLLKTTNIQKRSLSKYSRHLCELRNLSTNLTNALEVEPNSTNIYTMNEKLDTLTKCYAQVILVLEQFKVLLKSCPESGVTRLFKPNFDIVLTDSPIAQCHYNSEEWKALYSTVNTILNSIYTHKTAVKKLLNTLPKQIGKNLEVPRISQTHIDITKEAKEHLEQVKNDIYELILDKYQIKVKVCLDDDYIPRHPILRRIEELTDYLHNNLYKLEKLDESIDETMENVVTDQIIDQSEDLIATMLLIIQSIYKKHLPHLHTENMDVLNAIDEIIEEGDKEDKESKEILEDGHLKQHLQEKLTNDTRMLQVETLLNKMRNLLTNYLQYITTAKDVGNVKSAVMRLVPILEQTVLFVQYFIAQKVAVHRVSCKMLSVLLKIFSDLATKGFCKPSDIDMDGEGEDGPGKLSSGTGLGEGEGQKDISEQIENQDQLDDAQRPGEEKKEEDRDCKEEEKGVNMTDDFDSHLQDVDKKDADDSDQEDDEDDADKQMGDTDNAAEKLDQQIWGSDDEDDIDQENKKDKEEKGSGESTGEKEMGAKDEEQGNDDGADGKDKKEKKDINEIKEQEVDDDHVDPYHGNHEPLPEPDDLELAENMEVDGDESDGQEGETETENPFEIDVTKDNIPEENEEGQDENNENENKDNRNGLDVSSDEEDGDGENEKGEGEEKDKEENKPEDYPDETVDQNEQEDCLSEPETSEQDAETAEETPENKELEDLPKNDEKIDENDVVEQKEHEANPQANPSNDDVSAEDKAENAQMDQGTDDNVEINEQQQKDENAAPYEQAQEQVGEDKQSTGRSELDKSDKGHRGEKQAANRSEQNNQERNKVENKPGKTDEERTLGEVNEKAKKSKTVNVENQEESQEDGGEGNDNDEKEADAYEHVKQAKKDDLQAIDAATKEQADQQPTINKKDEEAEELKEDEQVPMEVDDEELKVEKSEELQPEKSKSGQDKEKDMDKSGKNKENGEDTTGETGVEVEGEKVQTMNVPRQIDTSYHTNLAATPHQTGDISVEQYLSIREWLISGSRAPGASSSVWRALWQTSGAASRALCERLRLVLEPTTRSRRAGDFRTGRAINMRRVIPYIASQFRKDRIWLRRTKPAKREYKIAIAMDDSSSMVDNRSKELAFESLALVSQALNLLESGDLAVLSFGEKPNLLHPFTEQFSEHSGSKILEQLRFDQTKTKIAQLLDFCTVLFEEQSIRSDVLNAKLLIIVSDGRGIFSEGETKVLHSVRRARQQGIFLVYVIIDNPDNKDSIMDIRRPLLDPTTNSLTGFVPYLDTFPFPFYLILRDMAALPTVLGDALRQWFELAANNAS